jgi:undecaprenyl-diphosphatase
MDLLQAILIAIVEGLTEYLPVSSTAHMIFTSSFFGIQEDDFVKLFQVAIQFGAILAVVVLEKVFRLFKNQFLHQVSLRSNSSFGFRKTI